MAQQVGVVIIKKYANRRLYNTGTSTYVTLDDLAALVKKGEDFQVFDAKSEADITHIILTQILLEQESKPGNGILPIGFLRKIIGLYDQDCPEDRPEVLDRTLSGSTDQPIRIYSKMRKSFGDAPLSINLASNMARAGECDDGLTRRPDASEIEELRSQLQQLQSKLERFS
jgi:polyhydroxyalkanoate synthesis repressor PhaR